MGRSTVPLFVLVGADYSPFKRHTFPDELDVCISVNSAVFSSFIRSQGLPFGRVCPRDLWSTPDVSVWWREVRASARSTHFSCLISTIDPVVVWAKEKDVKLNLLTWCSLLCKIKKSSQPLYPDILPRGNYSICCCFLGGFFVFLLN